MAQAQESEETVTKQDEREILPTDIRPIHYFVSYSSIDLEKEFKFNGRVEIDLDIKKETNEIKFNSADIDFVKISVIQSNQTQNIDISKQVAYDKKTEQTTVSLNSTSLKVGNAKLIIEFIGNLNDKMKGFYRSKYKLSDGTDGYAGTTQFEATDARRAFPCWDEPAVKATFSVEITCNKSLTVLSNMPAIDTSIKDENKTILFDKTPIMSTYLLAWVIGEFECIESKTQRDILVRVWTTIGNKAKAEFACDVACRCLDFYEKYFDINYPLPKCDMIAVPDFAAGAMENWGLITYREVALLCDKEKASLRAKQYVCIVVCHELAHQWFGNLVTMNWWSELWLNEGFACFMEYVSSSALYPNWNMWNLFLLSEYSRAYELDGMTTSHPIQVEPLNTAAEAEEMFDTISYCKGACVIRMLESFLGKETFRLALKKYLNNFKYQNAVTNDLWQFLSDESKKSVALIMKNWTQKQGFPLISASINEKENKLMLKQERFLISGTDEEKTIWTIPMNLRIETNDNQQTMKQILFDAKEKSFDIPKNIKYIHLNADSTGFYCCNYDEKMLLALNENLASLSIVDRMCLIRDTKALATSGVDGATIQLLNIIIASKDETEYPVWNELLSAMDDIVHIVDGDEEIMNNINSIMVKTLDGIYNKLGFDAPSSSSSSKKKSEKVLSIEQQQQQQQQQEEKKQEKEDETTSGLFRPLIIGAMAKYKNKAVITEIMKRFHAFMDDEKYDNDQALPASIRNVVYVNTIKNGGEKEFNQLQKYYNTTTDAMEKSYSLRSLGYVRYDSGAIESFLEWIISSDEVRSQDKVFPYRILANSSKIGRELSWKFLKQRWNEWFKLFEGGFLVQHLAKIPSSFVTFEKAKEVEEFYKTIEKDAAVCKRSMKQCIESITQNASWRDKELENIRKWAAQQQ